MIKIKEITVLKDGFLIRASDLESRASNPLIKPYLLVFNQSDNDSLAHFISEYTHGKNTGKSSRCPEEDLIKRYNDDVHAYRKVRRNLWYDLTQRDDRLGPGTGFIIYRIKEDKTAGTIDDIDVRKSFIKAFIHREEDEDDNEFYLWLGDYEKPIKFETEKNVSEYGVTPPKDIKKESNEKVKSKIQQQDIRGATKDEFYEKVNNLDTDFNYAENLRDILPALPQHEIVGREKDLKIITEKLQKIIHRDGQHSRQKLFIIHGLPGIGKTTMSIILSHDKNIQSLFKDGIIWTHLGKDPGLLDQFNSLAIPIHSSKLLEASTIKSAEQILRQLLKYGNYLIIVDDVWDISDVKPFLRLSTNTPTIVTTRLREIANELNLFPEDIYKLDILTEAESLKLLEELIPNIAKEHKNECTELVNTLEGLPLAIRVAGHLLRKQHDYGLSISGFIQELNEGRHLLESNPPIDMQILTSESSSTVAALLKRSTDSLKPITRECFAMLALFPIKPDRIYFDDLVGSWQVDNPENIIKELIDFGLIEPSSEKGTFQLHYLMALFARSILEENKTNV